MPEFPAPAPPTFDHSAFDALLRAHVRDGRVDYDAFGRAPEFRAYLDRLAAADPEALDPDEQLAFWLNAYNAYTIQLILKHGERRSIRNINKTLGVIRAYGPWKERLAVVGGRAYTLGEIEHEVIRRRYQEPRIHFALVCGANGCPPLRPEAYTGAALDSALDDQARRFLAESPDKNRVDVARRTAYLSPILVGFADYVRDFGGSKEAAARYVARYLPEGPERSLLEAGDVRVEQTTYDWSLNGTKEP